MIINQQVRHGLHSDCLRRSLQDLIRQHPDTPWVTDSRDFANDFAGTVRKLNEAEAVAAAGGALASGDRLRSAPAAARELFQRWGTPVFVTRGERGCLSCDGGGVIELPAPEMPTDIDPVGAGDRVPGRPDRRSGGRP